MNRAFKQIGIVLRTVVGVIFLIGISAFFIHNEKLASARSKWLESLRPEDVHSIVVSEYQNATSGDYGPQVAVTQLAVVTNAEEIGAFLNLFQKTYSARWSHFVTIDKYNIIIDTKADQYNYKAFRMNSVKYGSNAMWIAFTDSRGAFVPGLYKWLTTVKARHG
jgi:hypothetical protein